MPSSNIPLVVHATHEAGFKLGGIGAVLDGLLGSPAYNEAVGRTDPGRPDQSLERRSRWSG